MGDAENRRLREQQERLQRETEELERKQRETEELERKQRETEEFEALRKQREQQQQEEAKAETPVDKPEVTSSTPALAMEWGPGGFGFKAESQKTDTPASGTND